MNPQAPFPVDAKLTAVAVGYRNTEYIADDVCPRATVPSREFKWWEFPIEEGFSITDTKVGRTSRPNEIEFTATEKSAFVEDYGLDDPIPEHDMRVGAQMGHDPRSRAAERLTDYVMLQRELAVSTMLFSAASYPAGNKIDLSSAADRWDDFEESNPVDDILTGLDACLMRPNIGILGQPVWSKLRRHPRIAKAIHGNSGDEAVATRRAVADLLELDEIYVGRSRLNTARKGQAASLARVWGKHAAFIYRKPGFSFDGPEPTFCATAMWGERVSGSIPDPHRGLRGGEVVRVGESRRELIIAAKAGYFIENAVS